MSDVVAAAARDLYAVPLAEFVASRKALAASAKTSDGAAAAKEILALRKPTVTAWAMNLASREEGDVVADLVGLGARMRAAQARLDASVLTSVRGERDASVAAYVEHVAEVAEAAGAALSANGRDEVRASAIAALADESATEALTSGQLTRALSYSGFGEVDLSGAVGVTTSGSIMSVIKGGKLEQAVARKGTKAAADHETDEDGADEDADAGAGDEDDADDDELTAEELAQAVKDAKAAKVAARVRREAEAEVKAAQAEMKAAQAELDSAEESARTARRKVVAVQKRLDAARKDLLGHRE